MINIFKLIQDLDKEYNKLLAEYYRLGGTKEFLERSGIKKTHINGKNN